jgi:DNA-directed RNA polymerase subunit RPC12/RpoP
MSELLRKLISSMRCPACGSKFYAGSTITWYTNVLCEKCELNIWMDLSEKY